MDSLNLFLFIVKKRIITWDYRAIYSIYIICVYIYICYHIYTSYYYVRAHTRRHVGQCSWCLPEESSSMHMERVVLFIVAESAPTAHSKMWIEHAWGKLICLWLVFVWKKMRSLGAQDTNCLTASLLYNAFPILWYCAWSVVPKSILPMILHDSTSYYQWLVWFQKWGHWEVMSTKAFLLTVIFEATSLDVSLCWGFIISIMVQIRS